MELKPLLFIHYFIATFQPLHDWINGSSAQNQLGVEGAGGTIDIGNNQQQLSMASPNPQTPTSIPDILISSKSIIGLYFDVKLIAICSYVLMILS